jgi:hypothetical protein
MAVSEIEFRLVGCPVVPVALSWLPSSTLLSRKDIFKLISINRRMKYTHSGSC